MNNEEAMKRFEASEMHEVVAAGMPGAAWWFGMDELVGDFVRQIRAEAIRECTAACEADTKPCPFCGSESLCYIVLDGPTQYEGVSVTCDGCGATGPLIQLPAQGLSDDPLVRREEIARLGVALRAEAVRLWNQREDDK